MFSFKSMLLIDYETLMRAWSSQPSCTHSFIHPHLGSMYPCTVQRSTHWHRGLPSTWQAASVPGITHSRDTNPSKLQEIVEDGVLESTGSQESDTT